MKKTLTFLTAVAALTAGMALAQDPAASAPTSAGAATAETHKPSGAFARQRMAQALNLTDAQKQQAKTIFQQTRQSTQPIRDQLKQNRVALTAAVKEGNTAQIQQLSQTQGSLMGQMVAARAQARAQLYAILTPDQRTKADQMAARIKSRLQQRAARRSNG